MRLRIRTRLTLVSTALAIVLLGAAAVALVVGFRDQLRSRVDERLAGLFTSLADDPGAVLRRETREGEFLQYVAADGALVAGPGTTEPLLPPSVTADLGTLTFYAGEVRTVEELVPVRVLAGPIDEGGVLMVGVDVEEQLEAVTRLTTLLGIGTPVLLAALTVLGWVLAGAALRPVERLRSEAAAIPPTEPDRRLPVPETGDELQRLAETLNRMLDRLHEALDRERRFVDEASHELRTPLGVLSAEVELALREGRSREELEMSLRSIAEEAERLRRLSQDLLVLARSDRGALPTHRTEVDVSEVVERAVRGFEDRARRRHVRIVTGASGFVANVDADRLRQAVENLVDNAIRHAGSGGTIEIRAARRDGRLILAVHDTGPGFDRDVLERAFEPFARADDVRTGEGTGLGLAIVRAIVEAHGGSATARNLESGGAVVTLDLPA